MDFLKKHYEKILLAVLLLVFIGLLAFQLMLWQESKGIEDRVEVPPQVENYRPIDFDAKDSQYLALQSLDKQRLWAAVTEPGLDRRVVSNFMVPYPMAVCPHCKRLIPAASFPTGDDMGICPFADCRHELSAPETFARGKNLDTDRDGIPDEDEKKMGLNPNEAQDGREDADLDGFTNYEEYICKTDYKDPKSRPPYHEKMSVREVIQAMLPFKLKNVTYNGAKTKENAKLQIERKHPRPRLVDLKVGMEFVCYDMKYVIVDVIPKYVKSFNRGLGKEEEKDATEIIVSPVKNPNERILLPIRKDVPDPRLKTALEIINFKAATYGLKPSYLLGESFLLQFSSKTYPDEYTVVDIDPKKKTVTLRFKKDGKSYVIGETTMLDKKIQDIAKKQRAARRAAGRNSERE